MNKDTRNALQRATQSARRLLEKEFGEQLEGVYDILPDGTILSEPGAHLDERQRLTRGKIVSAIGHKRAGGINPLDAVADTVREAAFTTLNRFAALKMLEARKLIQPCISAGDQSSGFKEFTGLASGLATLPDKGYRLYLECLFDEIGCEVKVLFDRRDVASLLWPRRQALFDLIDILNDIALVDLWEADETIGWIYQYFNGEDERRKMREISQAPRNSRELAVRNQFFTPRYVVEFLTDNTLGRIWYEMKQGKTRIVDRCAYLVRRPTEIFLKYGEDPPAQDHPAELSQTELLKEPVYIPYRKKKDPRDIRLLDPAGGSGHFLLYGFDLFLFIYEEAWQDEDAPASEISGQSLRSDYPTIEDLRLAIPGLILRHNLHGIDIDPRAAQIASLALWMRAQRAYSDHGIPRDIRPTIRKTNFVVAEPMPGEQELLKEFIEDLNSKHPKVLGDLVQVVFKKMELAGEAGSLLKIEEEIHDAIAEAKEIWQREYMRAVDKRGREMLFSEREMGRTVPTQSGLFDVSDTDEQFWDKAENLLIDALHDYAKRAANGKGYQRRLFVEDAEQGFAFIDLCRKRYDVALMNPPFGQGSKASEKYLNAAYPGSGASEVCASFYSRVLELLHHGSFFGAISSRTFYYLYSLKEWRCKEGFAKSTLRYWIDLGQGILDDAMNETAAYVVSKGRIEKHRSSFGMCHRDHDKEAAVSAFVSNGESNFIRPLTDFEKLPDKPLCYWVSNTFVRNLSSLKAFGDEIADVQMGLAPRDEFRFSRLWWEVGSSHVGRDRQWLPYAKGGELSPYYSDVELLLGAKNDLEEIKAALNQKYPYLKGNLSWVLHPENRYFEPGLTFGQRTTFLRVSILPAGGYFSVAGKGIFGCSLSNKAILQLINTPTAQYLVSLRRESWEMNPQYQEGDVARMPWPDIPSESAQALEQTGLESAEKVRRIASFDEVDHSFVRLINQEEVADARAQAQMIIERNEKEADLSFSGLLGLDEQDRRFIDREILPRWHSRSTTNWYAPADIDCLQYMLGLAFGRWDVRIALNHSLAPKLSDPFDPLPICPPGMLVDTDGLPAQPSSIVSDEWLCARPDANTLPPEGTVKRATIPDSEYPLAICWNGILVDDLGHPDDIITNIRQVFDVIWQEKAHEIYAEAIEILDPGEDDLRPWFRANFFADHIKRYSKSRRKAPIYWCLSTPSRSYAVWLYYHRFSKDTLYKVNDCVKLKLQLEERKLASLRVEIGDSPTSAQRRQLADQEKFVAELKTFHEEIALTAPLWKPDLNDGVIINFAPLWRLAPHPSSWQKECKQTWDALVRGDYDWAHLAMHLWPERIVPKCQNDRSLAIAHGLEESLWKMDKDGKWKPQGLSVSELNDLVAARSSRSVKDALERMLAAPATAGNVSRRRRG